MIVGFQEALLVFVHILLHPDTCGATETLGVMFVARG
jgi:hypothetical protein